MAALQLYAFSLLLSRETANSRILLQTKLRREAIKELAFSFALLLMLLPCLKKFRFSYSLFMLCSFLLPLSTAVADLGLSSMVRYVLVLFPAFMYMGIFGRRMWFHHAYLILSSLLGGLFISIYTCWYWLG